MPKETYKIERRMIDISKWYQRSKLVPMWCLIECGTRYYYSHGGNCIDVDEFDYEKVLLKSDDYDTIKKEHHYFSGGSL